MSCSFLQLNGKLYFSSIFKSSTSSYTENLWFEFSNSSTSTLQPFSFNFHAPNLDSSLGFPVVLNGNIYFTPITAGFNFGVELYRAPNLNYSLVKDIVTGTSSSNPENLTAFNSAVFFSANDGINGTELWKSDGTAAGTQLFQDLNTGAGDSNPDNFNVLGAQLTFVATHNTLGRELFKTTGNTGSLVLIKDINTSGDSNPTNVKNVNGTLYFSADNGSVGQELWKSNGSSFGTTLIKDINPTGDSNASKFTQVGSDVYFVADDGVNGVELWKTDGTNAGTTLVRNINTSGNSNPEELIEYGGRLYFTADDGVNGKELWVSDGTLAGTFMIEINSSGSSLISQLRIFNNELFFVADNGSVGLELFSFNDATLSANDFLLNSKAIALFPNPTNNYFEIETEETLSKVEVYSLQGQVVKSFVPQNQYDISDLSSGMYFVKIKVNNNEITKRIVKQ